MTNLADHPFRELLEEVASRAPAPAGGSSAAWAGALGAGLVEMAAELTLAQPRDAEVHERMGRLRDRARELRELALELAERELDSYRPVIEARRLPDDHPERARRIEAALSEASEAPLDIAHAAAEVAALGAEAATTGNPNLRGDAIVSALLGEAAARSAACLVEINLAGPAGDTRLEEARAAGGRALAAREAALA